MRTIFKRQTVAVLFLAFGMATISSAQPSAKVPPKELVQFINDATRRGVTESKIKQQAVAIGWSAAMVDEAIANAKANLTADPGSQAVAPAKPGAPFFEVPSTASSSLLNSSTSEAGATPAGAACFGPRNVIHLSDWFGGRFADHCLEGSGGFRAERGCPAGRTDYCAIDQGS